jgi:hypothetical protein
MGNNVALPASPNVVESLQKSERPKRRFLPLLGMFSDMPDRGLFALFVTVGFALIFFAETGLWYAGFEADYIFSLPIACGTERPLVQKQPRLDGLRSADDGRPPPLRISQVFARDSIGPA